MYEDIHTKYDNFFEWHSNAYFLATALLVHAADNIKKKRARGEGIHHCPLTPIRQRHC